MNTVEDKDGGGGNAIFEDMELVSGQYGKYMTRNELFAQSFVMVVAGQVTISYLIQKIIDS